MHRFFCQYQVHFYTVGVDLRNAGPMLSVRINIGGMTHTNESPIFSGRFSRIAVAVELSKGPIISALQKFDFIDIFPVNPSSLAKYREAFQPSKAKDDPTDAQLAVDMLLRHPEHFKVLKPQSVEMRALATMVEQRRRLVNEQGRITNRLRSGYCQVNANHALLEVISPYPATRNQ
jgi:hypothetical protein